MAAGVKVEWSQVLDDVQGGEPGGRLGSVRLVRTHRPAHLAPPGIIRVARVGPASGVDARPVDNLGGAVLNEDDGGLGSVVRDGLGWVGMGAPLLWGPVTTELQRGCERTCNRVTTGLRIGFTLLVLLSPLPQFLGVGLPGGMAVSYTHLRAHETDSYLVCRLL